MLFIDKYKPDSLDETDHSPETSQFLKDLANKAEVPHMIIQGNPGSGKLLRTMLYLKEKFGNTVFSLKSQFIELKYPNKVIELQLIYSPVHYQINPSIHGVYDRLIIQDFLKENIQYQPFSVCPYRIIVIENADRLTNEAQQSLRRTLEKYIGLCRFIFLINNEGNLIEPLQSRCVKVRIGNPSSDQIIKVLKHIATAENIKINPKLYPTLVELSRHNLSIAINNLQLLSVTNNELLSKDKLTLEDFSDVDQHIDKIIQLIFDGTQLSTIKDIRNLVYDLLNHCVEPVMIVKKIMFKILAGIPDSYFIYKYRIIKAADRYENSLRVGSKPIYHLEGYIVTIFQTVKLLQKEALEKRQKRQKKTSAPKKEPAPKKKSVPKKEPVPAKETAPKKEPEPYKGPKRITVKRRTLDSPPASD
jgi:replication factor C subunit 3/5